MRLAVAGLGVGLSCAGSGAAIAAGADGRATVGTTRRGVHAARIARRTRAPTVAVRETSYGKILVNSKGYTLYLWAKDKRGSRRSACSAACLKVWPLVLVRHKPTAGQGVNEKLLGTIKVTGGNAVTYNGWPLYTFISDRKPGTVVGEGNMSFGGPRWVVSPSGKAIIKKYETKAYY